MKSVFAALVPPGVVVTCTLTAPAPAARAGVVQVIVVASITLKLVAAVPPKVTPVAPVKFVPKSVTLVPPAMVPVAGAMLVSVGGTGELGVTTALCQMEPAAPTVMKVFLKNTAPLRSSVVGAAERVQLEPSSESRSMSALEASRLIPAAK